MKMLNGEMIDFAVEEEFYFSADFPAPEELWSVLESELEESPWITSQIPVGLNTTSRNLARRWQEIDDSPQTIDDDHYLSGLQVDTALDGNTFVEPDFLVEFASFLLRQLSRCIQEVRHVQSQLALELAELNGKWSSLAQK